MPFDPFDIATPEGLPGDLLRDTLDDALKEYGDLDLLVELLQNALDALDQKRYEAIATAAGKSPSDEATVHSWNSAVKAALEADFEGIEGMRDRDSLAERALLSSDWMNSDRRRSDWWAILSNFFGCDPTLLSDAVDELETAQAELRVGVQLGGAKWITVTDSGIGIDDIETRLRHRSSLKREQSGRKRRLGVRGSHGWGLTAVLGMTDHLEVISNYRGEGLKGLIYKNYSSFRQGTVESPSIEELGQGYLAEAAPGLVEHSGTQMRVKLSDPSQENYLGHTLANFTLSKFANLLRLFTPVGQVNDYVAHPAYHTFRRDDLSVQLTVKHEDGTENNEAVDFDYFRLGESTAVRGMSLRQWIDGQSPRNVSVHAPWRSKQGDSILLSAAEIQPADIAHRVEDYLTEADALPGHLDTDNEGQSVHGIPRGFMLGLSGGLKSEYVARQPRGTSAAFRGIVLSETSRPTLGRRHVMDQRMAIPRAALNFETTYDSVRRSVLPTSEPPPLGPAAHVWRRDYIGTVLDEAIASSSPSVDLTSWCADGSLEAGVMLAFVELCQRGEMGSFKILRAHLQDTYDFVFLYETTLGNDSIPATGLANSAAQHGYAELEGNSFRQLGIGEFKFRGEAVIDDFDPAVPSKSPNSPDLLVCWRQDPTTIEDHPWSVEPVGDQNRCFPGQTCQWIPATGSNRDRPLPVVELEVLIGSLIESGSLNPGPEPWEEYLPSNYY